MLKTQWEQEPAWLDVASTPEETQAFVSTNDEKAPDTEIMPPDMNEASLETDHHEPNGNMTGRLRTTSWNKHDTKCIVYGPLYQGVALFTR